MKVLLIISVPTFRQVLKVDMVSRFASLLKVSALSNICLVFTGLLFVTAASAFFSTSKISYFDDFIREFRAPSANISTVNTTLVNTTTDKHNTSLQILDNSVHNISSNSSSTDKNLTTEVLNKTVQLKENYFIVFVIPTHPNKGSIRQVIRETWANVSAWSVLKDVEEDLKRIKLMFVMGSINSGKYPPKFSEELSQNKDDMFLIKDIAEGYYSLRYKITWGMNYSHQRYNFKYLVKTDDDVTVNLPGLIKALLKFPPGLRYTGLCGNKVGSPPRRWTYCSGGGYVLSHDLIGHIVNLPYSVFNRTMKPEDVFTGWLVWNVNHLNEVYDTKEYSVRAKWAYRALSLGRYKCGEMRRWFYHGYKGKSPEFRLQQFRDVFMNNTPVQCGT